MEGRCTFVAIKGQKLAQTDKCMNPAKKPKPTHSKETAQHYP